MKHLELKPSSNIKTAIYIDKIQQLIVEFNSGLVYSYSEVPQTIIDDWLVSESTGSYFSKNIRLNYTYTKESV